MEGSAIHPPTLLPAIRKPLIIHKISNSKINYSILPYMVTPQNPHLVSKTTKHPKKSAST
jgi:hypothetical protein